MGKKKYPNSKDYKELFRMVGEVTCLHSELLVTGSLKLGDPLIINTKGVWNSFIHKEKERKCLKKGLEIFSSAKKYKKYKISFKKYIKNAYKNIIPKYSSVPKKIQKKELQSLFVLLAKFWYLYGITEFSYHDLAYRKMQKTNDYVLKKNLDDLGSLKFEGRKILNAYVFKKGVIPNVLTCLSKLYLNKDNDCYYLYSDELIALFDGKKISKEMIKQRKKKYAVAIINGKLVKFSYKEAAQLTKSFLKLEEKKILKGIIANKGFAKGKGVITPMLNDMKIVKRVIKKMRKGDILVAESTTPELMVLCEKASAIVADQGGMLSHAAIVSRELNIPCIIGTKIATKIFKDGDYIEVDANKGIVRKIK